MRYGFFSDVHANEEALKAVLKDFQTQKLDKIFFLGDAVGYGASPNECLEIIKDVSSKMLMGNHDYACLGLLETEYFNQYAKVSIEWSRKVLSRKSIQVLSDFLMTYKFGDFYLVHSSPKEPDQWHYILDLEQAEENFSYFSKKICLYGHSHRPALIRKQNGTHCVLINDNQVQVEDSYKYMINIGSVGQPRDGDWRACYLIYDSTEKMAELRRIPYDLKKAQRKMKKVNLPHYLLERLALGR